MTRTAESIAASIRACSPRQDRVEVVHFPEKGLYLVICGVLPHFDDGMYGWVKVV